MELVVRHDLPTLGSIKSTSCEELTTLTWKYENGYIRLYTVDINRVVGKYAPMEYTYFSNAFFPILRISLTSIFIHHKYKSIIKDTYQLLQSSQTTDSTLHSQKPFSCILLCKYIPHWKVTQIQLVNPCRMGRCWENVCSWIRVTLYRYEYSRTPIILTANQPNHRNQEMRLLNKHYCWTFQIKGLKMLIYN
jgi:hypothetical protein